ncbi:ABC transporter substrate-binding protein [bacterium]|nr:ABC transporter substrate-binding protein [bacterium]
MKKLSLMSLIICFVISSGNAQTIDDLLLMSEEFPPYNYTEKGNLKGTSIDLVVLMLEKLHSKQTRDDIHMLPWARSYRILVNTKNTALFAVTRTAKREKQFKWVGPISNARNVLIARKDAALKIRTAEDIQHYQVGAVRDDAGQQLLISKVNLNKDDIVIAHSATMCVLMLSKKRIDLFAYDENVTKWLIKKENLNLEDYETVYVLEEGLHYIALHIDTPDTLITRMQSVLDEIKESGEHDSILDRYLK